MKYRFGVWLLVLIWGGGFFLVSRGAEPQEATARLKSVRSEVRTRELEVTIEVEGTFAYTLSDFSDPPRLVIEVVPVQEILASPLIEINDFGVGRIRTESSQPGTARVILEFTEKSPFFLVSKIPNGIQVICWSRESETHRARPAAKPAPPPPAAEEPPAEIPAPAKTAKPGPLLTLAGLNLVNAMLSDPRFEEIFGRRMDSALTLGLSQIFLTTGRLALAADIHYSRFSMTGQSTLSSQETTVVIAPLCLSLSLLFRTDFLWPFVAVGPAFYRYNEQSPLQDTSGSATGVSLQGGLYIQTPKVNWLKAKVFVKWVRAVAKENNLEVNLGGTEIGAGLVLGFSLF